MKWKHDYDFIKLTQSQAERQNSQDATTLTHPTTNVRASGKHAAHETR